MLTPTSKPPEPPRVYKSLFTSATPSSLPIFDPSSCPTLSPCHSETVGVTKKDGGPTLKKGARKEEDLSFALFSTKVSLLICLNVE